MLKIDLQSFFILLSGKPEEKESAETPKTFDNLMPLQNPPSEMLIRTVGQVVIQGLLNEKVLLQFLPKSEGTIATPASLVPTNLLIDKENTNDLDSTDKSLSEAPFFTSTNPQYVDRLFIELQVQ